MISGFLCRGLGPVHDPLYIQTCCKPCSTSSECHNFKGSQKDASFLIPIRRLFSQPILNIRTSGNLQCLIPVIGLCLGQGLKEILAWSKIQFNFNFIRTMTKHNNSRCLKVITTEQSCLKCFSNLIANINVISGFRLGLGDISSV